MSDFDGLGEGFKFLDDLNRTECVTAINECVRLSGRIKCVLDSGGSPSTDDATQLAIAAMRLSQHTRALMAIHNSRKLTESRRGDR